MKITNWLESHRRLAMTCVLMGAALLRMQHLAQPYIDSYAWRESDTASIATAFANGAWNIFLPQVRWGGPGPNHIGAEFQTVSYIAALGYRLVGAAPWVGRLVSVAFGLWGIFALYKLVRRVWGTSSGIAAAAVMAVLPGSVFIERSFLSDGAMTALMTTSLWLLVEFRQTGSVLALTAATVTGMLGCLTKLPGAVLVLPAIYVVTTIPKLQLGERRTIIQLSTAAFGVILPVLAYYLWARHVALSAPPYHFTGEGKFVWSSGLFEWIRNDYYLPKFWQIVSQEHWGPLFISFALIGALVRPGSDQFVTVPWLFHAWLAALLIRYLLEAQHLVTDPYNIHLFNPVIAAFSGQALVRLATGVAQPRYQSARATLASILLATAAVAGHFQVRALYSDAYRDHYVLARLVATLSRPEELVISMGLEPVLLYHSERNGWVFPPEEIGTMSLGSQQPTRDYGSHDVAILHALKARGAQWLAIPSWNSYAGASAEQSLRSDYPSLYAGLLAEFEVVREIPEGLILRAKPVDPT